MVTHFESFQIEEFDGTGHFDVRIGDNVEVFAPQDEGLCTNGHFVWICRIDDLYETPQGTRMFTPHWYYSVYDTLVADDGSEVPGLVDEELSAFDSRELFEIGLHDISTNDNPNEINSIYRKVQVVVIGGGEKPTDFPEDAYFLRFSYTRRFHTFRDLTPFSCIKLSDESKKIYRLLELYSGCGGLSFVGQKIEDYSIEHCFAVDSDKDSLLTYFLNHPETKTFHTTVEHFLKCCTNLKKIFEEYLPEAINQSFDKKPLIIDSSSKICDLTNLETDDPIVLIRNETDREKMKYHRLKEALSTGLLMVEEFKEFLWKIRKSKSLPLPIDVDIIAGGPPCQGLSMKNHQNDKDDIFSSERNQQIKHFLRCIAFFRPNFIVLENIPQMFEQEDGLYIRFLMMHLITLGYQIRCGVLSSACYGTPQMRFRCFVIAALSGYERLPPLPHPTFKPLEKLFISRTNCLSKEAKSCVVEIHPSKMSSLLPQTLNWDALEDLPLLDNWSMTESTKYKMKAQRPYQLYLRRNEDKDPKFLAKAKRALAILKPGVQFRIDALLALSNQQKDEEESQFALGHLACSSSLNRERLWEMYLSTKSPQYRQELKQEKEIVLKETGKNLKKMAEEFNFEYQGPCMNHRCSPTNKGDHLRIQMIPKNGGDFMSLPGVVIGKDYICVGHTHGVKSMKPRLGNKETISCCPAYKPSINSTILEHEACSAFSEFVATGDFAVPKWMIKTWNRKRGPAKNTFGRLEKSGVFGTLLTGVKASCGYAALHPYDDRYVSVREAARIQGFPDDYVFVAMDTKNSGPLSGVKCLDSRFEQIGNAVSPPVASMIGKVLLRAIIHRDKDDPDVIFIPDKDLEQAREKATKPAYIEEHEDEVVQEEPEEAEDFATNLLDCESK